MFRIEHKDATSHARTGILKTAHGDITTPIFLPIGTRGAVKGLNARELHDLGAKMILANTYHLWQRPGDDLIARAGGLHAFMGWDRPIFTDSGGFQIFSLGERANDRGFSNRDYSKPFSVKVSDEGVSFQRSEDGIKLVLTPEKSMQIQYNLGSDIAVALDEFTGDIFDKEKVARIVERTTRWAKRSKDIFIRLLQESQHSMRYGSASSTFLLGIVQGGMIPELRKESAQAIREVGFDGYAIGGVAVGGESSDMQYEAVDMSVPHLEEGSFKHLFGVGLPEQIIQSVARGIDSFDCVIPTREARHGRAYIDLQDCYTTIDVGNSIFNEKFEPLDPQCRCSACASATVAYIHHLLRVGEFLGQRLLTIHNLHFFIDLMERIRGSIKQGKFLEMLAYKHKSINL